MVDGLQQGQPEHHGVDEHPAVGRLLLQGAQRRGVRRRARRRHHAHRPARHERRPRVIVPLDEVASGLELTEDDFAPAVWNAGVYKDKRYGIPLDIHPLGFYANTAQLTKAGHRHELPTDAPAFEAAVKALQEKGGVQDAVLGHRHVAGAPDVHLADRPVRRQHLRRGGRQGDLQLRRRRGGPGVAARVHRRRAPARRTSPTTRRPWRSGSSANSLTWDGIWMMNEWEKVEGLEWAAAAVPTIGDKPAVWASSHNFVVTTQADQGPEQARGVPGVHLLHLRAVHRVGQVRSDPGPQQRPGVRRVRRA